MRPVKIWPQQGQTLGLCMKRDDLVKGHDSHIMLENIYYAMFTVKHLTVAKTGSVKRRPCIYLAMPHMSKACESAREMLHVPK